MLNFGRRPSQNPQKLTLAALKFGVGNVKNRRFQLGLVRFLPGFYRNTHREPLNTTTKGFGLKPQRSTQVVFGPKSVSRQFQLVGTDRPKQIARGGSVPTATNIYASETVLANKFWSPSDIMIAHCKIFKKPDREVDLSISDFWLQLTLRLTAVFSTALLTSSVQKFHQGIP